MKLYFYEIVNLNSGWKSHILFEHSSDKRAESKAKKVAKDLYDDVVYVELIKVMEL